MPQSPLSPTDLPPTDRTGPAAPGLWRRVWSRLWRAAAVAVIGLVAFTVGSSETIGLVETGVLTDLQVGGLIVLDVTSALVAFLAMIWRRRAPLTVAVIVVIAGTFSSLAVGAVVLCIVAVATERRWIRIVVLGVVFAVMSMVGLIVTPGAALAPGDLALGAAVIVGLYLVLALLGLVIGGRRALLRSLREQASSAVREQEALADSARTSERARIAREMHDALGHRLSLVAMHAGALEFRPDRPAQELAGSAGVVRENAQLALSDLRAVLGVLGDPIAPDLDSPRPTLTDLRELVSHEVGEGMTPSLDLRDGAESWFGELPGETAAHLYRIVQESLTNVRKHAPGRQTSVTIGGVSGERVTVEVRNRMPLADEPPPSGVRSEPGETTTGAGRGLLGLQERARLGGGTVTARLNEAEAEFIVSGELPWSS